MKAQRSRRLGLGATELARQIALDIVAHDRACGTMLGSQRDLAAYYQVSLPTLGQALRTLEDDGVATTKAGRGGGVFVSSPPTEVAIRVMQLHLASRTGDPAHIHEARDILEAAIVDRASTLLDRASLSRIEEQWALVDERSRIAAIDATIVEAARHPVLALFARVILLLEPDSGDLGAAELADELALRSELVDAIVGSERDRAVRLMKHRRIIREATPPRPLRPRRRSELLAEEIMAWMRDGNLAPGDRLGSESELVARFASSLLAMRSAFRLLERTGLIVVMRGRGGGIFAGDAAPDGAVATIALYLSAIRLLFSEQIEARIIFEAAAAKLAAERITEDQADRLKVALDAETKAVSGEYSRWVVLGTLVERRIVEACNNPVLSFFVMILIELSLYQAAWKGVDIDRFELARSVECGHRIVAEAVLQGRSSIAYREMLFHAQKLRDYVSDS